MRKNERRIFICAERFFPRGDAGANRVLYIAKALQMSGWEVLVISINNNNPEDFNDSKDAYFYDGVEYNNITYTHKGIVAKFERRLMRGFKTTQILKQYNINSRDIVVVYSSNYIYANAIRKMSNKVNFEVVYDVVEWHQPFQYEYGKYDMQYILYNTYFNRIVGKAKNVIAISHYLKLYFEKRRCNVLQLPIYIDSSERVVRSKTDSKTRFIYPGSPFRKDSLLTMLQAFELLDDIEKSKTEFHLTGVSKESLYKCVPNNKELIDELEVSCLHIHEWLEYSDLIKLYEGIDFALIARPINIVTQSNFPSKVPELLNKGIPIVMNICGDITDYLIDDEDSILFNKCLPIECVEAIRRCLNKKQSEVEEMHIRAKSNAIRNFDYKLSSEKLNEYFNGL